MSNFFEFHAESRNDTGKHAARRLRRSQWVPAILYGGEKDPQLLSLKQQAIATALKHEAVFSHILTLHIQDRREKVILKEVKRHPFGPVILHMDFMRISESEKITLHVPLHFMGAANCPGVKKGGIVSHLMTDIEVACLPADLPEFIEVDITQLDLDHPLHLSDIQLPKGVQLAHMEKLDAEHNKPVVSVHMPRATKEDIEAEAKPIEEASTIEKEETKETASSEAPKEKT